jgi:phosphinothricin acetyltransferase
MDYAIDTMAPDDWHEVRAIYLQGILTGDATFESEAPSWDRWDAGHLKECRLVARDVARDVARQDNAFRVNSDRDRVSLGSAILGWAALSRVSSRQVYAGVTEVSIYVGELYRGRGIGQALLGAVIQESERCGIWTLQAGIFPENQASIALHKRNGFREVGRRERLGKMNGVWRDVVLLERRSRIAGQD